jgi:Flp pilus assembly protein TadD
MNRSQRRANKRHSGGTDPAHLEMLQAGLQHHQAGQLQQAEQIYRQVLDANPDEPDANYLLGMLLNQSGDNDAAVEHVTRSIKARPKFPPAHNNLGTIYE